MNRFSSFLIVCAAVFAYVNIFTCSISVNEQQSGTGSEIDNVIMGKVVFPEGKPANNILLHMKRADYLPGTSEKRTDSIFTSITDNNGRFQFFKVPVDTYIITGDHKESLFVLIGPVIVTDTNLLLPPDTLQPAGAIEGTIHLENGGYCSQIVVLVFGLGRFAEVNQDGSFMLEKLPEGVYRLRFMDLTEGSGFLDTAGIKVKRGESNRYGSYHIASPSVQF